MISYIVLYLVALFQGFMIVLFPASSAMLTHLSYHNLSVSEYGALFVPLILGILVSARRVHLYSLRSVLIVTLLFMALSQILFFATSFMVGHHVMTFFILLIALLFLGFGYGAGVAALNAYIPSLFPKRTAVAMSSVYTVSGFGCATAPLIFNAFFANGMWRWLPSTLSITAIILAYLVRHLPDLRQAPFEKQQKGFLFYALFLILFLYGFLETTFGNWGIIYLYKGKEFSIEWASRALFLFWGSVVLGRLIISFLALRVPFQMIFALLPWLIGAAFLLIPEVHTFESLLILFSFAGFACSGCFPLGFALGERCFPKTAATISGALLSAYMLGFGTSAYGIGLLHQMGLSFSKLYHLAVIPALLMGFLLLILIQKID